jgi:DNA-binding transcriptional LysR family regulator
MDRPKSTVSAAVGRLETELGSRLLERTTRQVRLTESGESLFHSIGTLFAGLREARIEALAQGEAVAGTLRIAAPYEFGAHHLGSVACEMMKSHPNLKVRVDVEHGAVNPLDRRYDIAFAMLDAGLPASSLIQRRMFTLDRGVFAAPELLYRLGEPSVPQDLAAWPLLCGSSDTLWSFTAADGSVDVLPTPISRLNSGNADMRLQAAIAGLGVARITATFCERAVREGRLCQLLPAYTCAPLRVYALLPARRLMQAKVRLFLDALGEQAGVDA